MKRALLFGIADPATIVNTIVCDDSYVADEGFTFVLYDGPASPGWLWDGKKASPAPVPPVAPTIPEYTAAIQAVLDAFAQSWGYDDARSAISYVGDPNVQYNLEGVAIRNWRSAVWVASEQILATVDPKNPPTIAEVIDELPTAPKRPVVPVTK